MAPPLLRAALILALHMVSLAVAQNSTTGFSFFPNGTLGSDANDVSSACTAALMGNVACDAYLLDLVTSDYYGPIENQTVQDGLCAPSCRTALSKYRSAVATACAQDSQPFAGLPATYFVDVAFATYNLTCLKDPNVSGKYCTDTIFDAFGDMNSEAGQGAIDLPPNQQCSICLINAMRQIQSTPYSNYNDALAQQWSSIQRNCSLSFQTSVQPLQTNVTGLPGYGMSNGTLNRPIKCLSGITYIVVNGDTCVSISQAKNVSTGALTVLNQLLPGCPDLQIGQQLCLPQTCTTYTIKSNDTCTDVAINNTLSLSDIMAYNPMINQYCNNLIIGNNICISSPGGDWNGTVIPGVSATQTALYAATTVAPPGAVASGTTTNCGKFYRVQSGDYCQLVALNQTVSLPLFQAMNPSIDSGCTNLMPGLWYCIQPTVGWNDTFTDNPQPTGAVPAPTATPPGTTSECYKWHTVASGDYCALLQASYGISMAQLQLWNPDLKSDCSNLILNEAYCVSGGTTNTAPKTSAPTSTVASTVVTSKPSSTSSSTQSVGSIVSPPAPTSAGATNQCFQWYVVVSGDYCSLVTAKFSITMAQLQLWNPDLHTDCANLILGDAYCVRGASKAKRDDDGYAEYEEELVERVAVPLPSPGGGVPVGWPYPVFGAWGSDGLAFS